MDKHTPGPWGWGSFARLLVVPIVDGQPDKHSAIADLGEAIFPYDKTPESEEAYANATLIAAAPELLAALEASLAAMELAVHFRKTGQGRPPEQTCMDEILQAHAAIAKAKGEAA
jgi:hypothetical protein